MTSPAFEFMKSVYLDLTQPPSIRLQALEALLPYATREELVELERQLQQRKKGIANASPPKVH